MFGLFGQRELLDEPSRQWLFEVYAWALRNFGTDVFYQDTALVTPTNQHFPGRADSPHEMARLVLGQVQNHAGLGHWPCRLSPPETFHRETPPRLAVAGAIRGPKGVVPEGLDEAHVLDLSYDPNMVRDPEVLIAYFAHTLAHFMGTMAAEPAPGGEDNWPHVTEVLAVFMGFGVMMANTAYQAPKGGCGGCAVPGGQRSSFLSQYDMTYALALFSVLKGIPNRDVLSHLKSPLRGFYKAAVKEIGRSQETVSPLQAIDAPLPALTS